MKPGYKQTEVGVIPEEWDVRTIRDVSDMVTVGFVGSMAHLFTSNGVPLLRGQNVLPGRIELTDSKFISPQTHSLWKKSALRGGDIVIVRVGYPGTSAVIPRDFGAANAASLVVVRPDSSCIDSDFMCWVLLSDIGRRQVKAALVGGAQQVINIGTVASLLLPVPANSEQRAIAEALSDVDGLLGGLDRLIAKKRDLKQAAMQQLLTGQTRLPGFHGEWEVKTFGEVAIPRRERIDPRRTGVHDFCIELEHIESGSGQILGSTSTGTQASLKSIFHPGDVLFGKLRAYLRKYWRATRSGVCSTEIWVLVPREAALTSEFLFQIIQTDDFIDAASNSYGTHMPRSDWNVVKNYELKIPLAPEQTAIASVLTEMDAELAALEQRREKTRALKQAIMQELLTGRTRLL